MRLRWIRLSGKTLSGGIADLQLGGVTALWGLNDAGKSTLLRTVHDALAIRTGRARPSSDAVPGALRRAALQLDAREANALATFAAERIEEKVRLGHPAAWLEVVNASCQVITHGPGPERDAVRESLPTGRMLRPWLDLCLSFRDLAPEQRTAIADALEEHRTLVLEDEPQIGSTDMRPMWGVPSAQAQALGLLFDPEIGPWVPLVEASSVGLGPQVLPTPVQAPVDWAVLVNDLEAHTQRAVPLLLSGGEDWRAEIHVHEHETLRRRWGELICAVANRRVVPGVSERYAFEYGPSLRVRSRRGSFEPQGLAQGYHLWFQLALMDALEIAETTLDAIDRVHPDVSGDSMTEMVEGVLDAILYADFEAPGLVDTLFALSREWTPDRAIETSLPYFRQADAVVERSSRLYLLDEPEAHLHPAFQRDAARWIRGRTDDKETQVLLATHAPAFLGISGSDTRLAHVERCADDTIELRDLDPRHMEATDRKLRDLGLDRGELLGLHRAVLFVEGDTDQAVLEQLCHDRVRDIGVLVQPFHGLKGSERILEAVTLLRVLGPPFHVLVDDMPPEKLAEIEGATTQQLEEWIDDGSWGNHSQRFTAKLTRAARNAKRKLFIHGIPHVDILGALDDEIVKGLADGKRPYPGFETVVKRHPKGYSDELPRYGVHKTKDFFGEAARRMRAAGQSSPSLDRVLDEVEESVEGWS